MGGGEKKCFTTLCRNRRTVWVRGWKSNYHQSLVCKLQRVQKPIRALPHVHITQKLRHLHWLPVRARISCKTVCLFQRHHLLLPCLSLTFYICTILLDLFAPVPTPTSSKLHFMSARQKVIVLSLTLVLLSGTHCHCTLEMLQLSTPSSLL